MQNHNPGSEGPVFSPDPIVSVAGGTRRPKGIRWNVLLITGFKWR